MPRTLRPRLLGAALAAPYYAYPYPMWLRWCRPMSAPVHQAPAIVAQAVQRAVCYVGGCYHLAGDGVTTAYQWVRVPSVPVLPPGPPTR